MHYKAYEKHYTVAGGNPIIMPTAVGSSISGSSEPGSEQLVSTFPLNFPHACKIKKFVVRQATGTLVPFEADLLNSASVPVASGESLWKVLPTQVQNVAGNAVEMFDTEGYTFTNMDGTISVPIKKIYLRLQLLSDPGEVTYWEASIAGETMY